MMTTIMTKKDRDSKKPSHGGDTPQDLSGNASESRRPATRQKRSSERIVPVVTKNQDECPVPGPNDADGPSLPCLSSPSEEEVETLETLLASVPVPTDIPGYLMVPMKEDPDGSTGTIPNGQNNADGAIVAATITAADGV